MSQNINRKHTNLRDVRDGVFIGLALTAVSYFIGLAFGWVNINNLNWLEVFAVFTSYACTYLCVRERRINYPIGAVSSAAYALLFLQSSLLASAILNLYLVPTLIYGWIRWRKDANTRPVTRITVKWLPAYAAVTLGGYITASILSNALGGKMAWTDSLILAGTILAQFLLDNKKLENWIIWALVNIFAIYTYFTTGPPLVAIQYVFFLANTIYGYAVWKRSKDHEDSLRTNDSYASNIGTLATDPVR